MAAATNTEYVKLKIAMRYYLLGCKAFKAVEAMELANILHCGTRADHITPEFQHQIEMAHFLRALSVHLIYPEETFCTIFLHDGPEDYPEQLSLDTVQEKFGVIVRDGVSLVTKWDGFDKTDQSTYFDPISENPISSVVKGVDRINNLGSMVGVFSKAKQRKYIEEVEDYFFPMLKRARRLFPQQEPIYENIKFVLTSQVNLLKETLKYE